MVVEKTAVVGSTQIEYFIPFRYFPFMYNSMCNKKPLSAQNTWQHPRGFVQLSKIIISI
jgi:hypothetical protein